MKRILKIAFFSLIPPQTWIDLTAFKGKLAHDLMISHLVFIFGPLALVKTVITENNENIHIISVYKEKKI